MSKPRSSILFDRGLGPLRTRAWSLDVDWAALDRLQKENANKSLVFLPTHRSYADPCILGEVLRATRMSRNYILGGDNLDVLPVGAICRRAGVVFIRRSFQGRRSLQARRCANTCEYLVASGA